MNEYKLYSLCCLFCGFFLSFFLSLSPLHGSEQIFLTTKLFSLKQLLDKNCKFRSIQNNVCCLIYWIVVGIAVIAATADVELFEKMYKMYTQFYRIVCMNILHWIHFVVPKKKRNSIFKLYVSGKSINNCGKRLLLLYISYALNIQKLSKKYNERNSNGLLEFIFVAVREKKAYKKSYVNRWKLR